MFRISISLLFFSGCIISCNPGVEGKNGVTYKSAVAYNDYILNRQAIIISAVLDFGKTTKKNLDSAEVKRKEFSTTSNLIISEVEGMPAYRGDSSFRNAAVRYFSFFKRLFEQDYKEYLRLLEKGKNLASADVDEIYKTSAEMKAIMSKTTREEESYDKDFRNAQQRFADENNMKLTENKIQREIEKSNN